MIKQFIPREACLDCQGCCRFAQADSAWVPSLLNEEIERFLNQGIAAAIISPRKKFKIVPFPKQKVYLCPLFNYENNECKAYDSRPLECQLYPFLICAKGASSDQNTEKGLQREQICLAADYNCPFLKEKQNTREFQEHTQYLVSLLQNPPYAELIRKNPHIVQSYVGVAQLQELSL